MARGKKRRRRKGRQGKGKKEWRERRGGSNNEKPTHRIIWQGEKIEGRGREEREKKERVAREKGR